MTQNVCIKLASERVDTSIAQGENAPRLYTPGEIITQQGGYMRGHGTYTEDDYLKASVAGVIEQVNKLISVRPLKSRYVGEIGDVVVGRITEVQQKRWKVDTNSRLDSILLLSSVNLPGGELRRRSAEDEQAMRRYLQEGDLISAEVQNVYSDGSLSLHTRSLKYGKLSQGVMVKVFPSLVKRRKNHFHNLPCGASIILGNNGFIWICPTINQEAGGAGGFTQNLEEVVPRGDREIIARIRNVILALAHFKLQLCDTSITYAVEESLSCNYTPKDLITPENMLDIVMRTRHRIQELNE